MQSISTENNQFVDRRQGSRSGTEANLNRRQFGDSRNSGRPEVDELARAVDEYKLKNHRRFITFEELYDVMTSLGYHK